MSIETEADEFRRYLETQCPPNWHIVTSKFENTSDKQLNFIIEPWGMPVPIPPGIAFDIVAEEPKGHAISLTVSNDDIQIWANGLMEVFVDGVGHGTTGEFYEWQKERIAKQMNPPQEPIA